MESILKGSGQIAHNHVVAMNTSLVLWAAGVESDLKEGFYKALSSIKEGKPWEKFISLRNYLKAG